MPGFGRQVGQIATIQQDMPRGPECGGKIAHYGTEQR